ncbi:hypothetical protein [Aestuariivirga sp.]|uniref:hypothetical protein n=1 Tax=Aestuariivirga sp. TaxID=2650926 RepID=UPI0025BFB7A1|nr:hypothetical protein [Aestuariivirga sp.]MCA3554843.1 hypothetical protein [Aestuariivirga sp.]
MATGLAAFVGLDLGAGRLAMDQGVAHVPIRWNHLIEKNKRQINGWSMILSQKRVPLLRIMLWPVFGAEIQRFGGRFRVRPASIALDKILESHHRNAILRPSSLSVGFRFGLFGSPIQCSGQVP